MKQLLQKLKKHKETVYQLIEKGVLFKMLVQNSKFSILKIIKIFSFFLKRKSTA